MNCQEMSSLLPLASLTCSEPASSPLPSEGEDRSSLQSREDGICEELEALKVEDVKDENKVEEDFFNKKYKQDFINFLKHFEPVQKAKKKTIEEFQTYFIKGNQNSHNSCKSSCEGDNHNSRSNVPPCLKSLKEMILDDFESGKLFKAIEVTDYFLFTLELYLKWFDDSILDVMAENLLKDIFTIGEKCRDFSDDEKEIIGKLMIHAVIPIKNNIKYHRCEMKSTVTCLILRKRSALQYLVEEYGQFPVDNTTLASKLEEANIKESIDILDYVIQFWERKPMFVVHFEDEDNGIYHMDVSGADCCSYIPLESLSDYEYEIDSDVDSDVESGGVKMVPSSHHAWWYK